jgi:cytochrome c-type biogenesis protein CcmF
MQIAGYTIVNKQYSQDELPNYETDYAMLDVYKGDKLIAQMNPEKRFYKASQQPSTMVAIHSTLKEDLYVVYAGRNTETDRPIIKAFVNPLVSWVWIGVLVIVLGTGVALLPNIQAASIKIKQPALENMPQQAEAVAGD